MNSSKREKFNLIPLTDPYTPDPEGTFTGVAPILETTGRESAAVTFAYEADQDGTIKGYASTFATEIQRELPTFFVPGVWTKTINERASRVKVLWSHDVTAPIGKPLKLKETEQGLYFEAKISQTTLGKDILTLMRDGVVDRVSVGFEVVKQEIKTRQEAYAKLQSRGVKVERLAALTEENRKEYVRLISEAKLFEFSLVTEPADENAKITEVHEQQKKETLAMADHELICDHVLDLLKTATSIMQPPDGGGDLEDWYRRCAQANNVLYAINALIQAPMPMLGMDEVYTARQKEILAELRTLSIEYSNIREQHIGRKVSKRRMEIISKMQELLKEFNDSLADEIEEAITEEQSAEPPQEALAQTTEPVETPSLDQLKILNEIQLRALRISE